MKYLERVERFVVSSLLVMMVVVVCLATLDLAWLLLKDIITPPRLLLEIDELLDVFGLFLLVLIGIELLDSIRIYREQKSVHVEVVMTVAMIAIARKVIILDIKEISSLSLLGIAAIIAALSLGYFLIKRTRPTPHK
jgi:uncharacterized membrane protein (DUF373 family)